MSVLVLLYILIKMIWLNYLSNMLKDLNPIRFCCLNDDDFPRLSASDVMMDGNVERKLPAYINLMVGRVQE